MDKYRFPPKLNIDEPNNGSVRKSYAHVQHLRMQRIHQGGSYGFDRLGWIKEEVKARIGICKREIYFIGELRSAPRPSSG